MIWQTIFQPLTFQQKKARSHRPSCFRETRCGQNTLQKTSWQEQSSSILPETCSGTVMGTGMGCASMGIYSHELMNFYGVKKLVRVGTAGAMQKTTHIRDLVLAMGACTGTGYVKELGLPDGYSCIADFGLLIKAALEAEQRGLSYHVGNVLTSDVFYAPEKAKKEGVGYEDVGVLAAEMETAALYANAALAGAQALSILTISDSLITGESTTAEERQNSFMDMVQVALEIL